MRRGFPWIPVCLALVAASTLPLLAAEKKKEDGKKEADEKKDDDKPKWDVTKPPGPSHEVKIDVDEGTWMTVDLSPEAKIAFALSGR